MNLFTLTLMLAALGCALVAGITLIFAIVIMPGLKTLGDRGFLEGFKAIDRVIQDNQPMFMLVWLGSAVALIAATVLGFLVLSGLDLALLIGALMIYILGVQVVTVAINVPLNNRLQATDIASLDEETLIEVREAFEPRWLRWNAIRTGLAIISVLLQLVVLVRL